MPTIRPYGQCRYPNIFLKNSTDPYEANGASYGPLGQNLHRLGPKIYKKTKIEKIYLNTQSNITGLVTNMTIYGHITHNYVISHVL